MTRLPMRMVRSVPFLVSALTVSTLTPSDSAVSSMEKPVRSMGWSPACAGWAGIVNVALGPVGIVNFAMRGSVADEQFSVSKKLKPFI